MARERAIAILDSLRDDWNLSDKEILEYIIYNNLGGFKAEQVMLDVCEEFDMIPALGEEDESECPNCGEFKCTEECEMELELQRLTLKHNME